MSTNNSRLSIKPEQIDSHNQFETIFNESSQGNKIINAELRIVKVNKALTKILGYSEKEFNGMRITDISHPDYVKHWKTLQTELWENKRTSFNFETCIIKKDRMPLWCRVTSILFEDKGETLGYTVLEDISELKELDRLREKAKKQQQLLEQKENETRRQRETFELTIHTQEEERRRISESMHNSLGQLLYAVKLSLAQIELKKPQLLNEDLQTLKQTKSILDESIKECRRLSHELTPTILENFGLIQAVEDISRQFSGTAEFTCKFTGFPRTLDKYSEVAIYRIIQELLLNVVKHAQATKVHSRIEANKKEILISIEDNGKGFEVDKIKGLGIGLQTIKTRVKLLNGKMEILTVVSQGTVIKIRLPNTM